VVGFPRIRRLRTGPRPLHHAPASSAPVWVSASDDASGPDLRESAERVLVSASFKGVWDQHGHPRNVRCVLRGVLRRNRPPAAGLGGGAGLLLAHVEEIGECLNESEVDQRLFSLSGLDPGNQANPRITDNDSLVAATLVVGYADDVGPVVRSGVTHCAASEERETSSASHPPRRCERSRGTLLMASVEPDLSEVPGPARRNRSTGSSASIDSLPTPPSLCRRRCKRHKERRENGAHNQFPHRSLPLCG
jgi:hypothetical protein